MNVQSGTTLRVPEREADRLVGDFRRFGPYGEVYEVTGVGQALPDGDRTMHVRLPRTGESVDYRLSRLLRDPTEG